MAAHWKDKLPLKLINVATYILFLSSNAYSSLKPDHHGGSWGAGSHDTYITPQAYLFALWPLIHLLLLGTVIYQFFADGFHPVIEGISWRFPLLGLLNSAYATLQSARPHGHKTQTVYNILAFVVILLVTGTVSTVYKTLKFNHKSKNILDTLFVHIPFSLYHGFSIVLLFVSGFQAFGKDAALHAPGVWTKIFVTIALLLLEGIAAGYVFHGEGDLLGSAVISYALFAIFQHQTIAHSGKWIHYSALVFWIISLVAVLRGIVAAFQNRNGRIALHDEERAPLVG